MSLQREMGSRPIQLKKPAGVNRRAVNCFRSFDRSGRRPDDAALRP
jgi:hypothetical protein